MPHDVSLSKVGSHPVPPFTSPPRVIDRSVSMCTLVVMRHLLIGLLALACSAESGSGERPLTCDPADRNGTYWLEYTTRSGNCGDVPGQLVRTTDSATEGCALDAPDTWSDNGCTLERSFSCVMEDGTQFSAVGITHQEDANGDVITGTMSVNMANTSGTPICTGSYSVRYDRQ